MNMNTCRMSKIKKQNINLKVPIKNYFMDKLTFCYDDEMLCL